MTFICWLVAYYQTEVKDTNLPCNDWTEANFARIPAVLTEVGQWLWVCAFCQIGWHDDSRGTVGAPAGLKQA